MKSRRLALVTIGFAIFVGCAGSESSSPSSAGPAATSTATTKPTGTMSSPMPSGSQMMPQPQGVTIQMDFTHDEGFFSAPFPSEDRRLAGDMISIPDFPNPMSAPLIEIVRSMIQTDARGFGVSSGIYFTTSAALGTTFPDPHASIAPASPIYLESVDASSVDFHKRYPLSIDFRADGGPFGAPNLLTLLPYQGIPLRPHTLYAAVVLRSVNDATGTPLGQSTQLQQILAGTTPVAMSGDAAASYATALSALKTEGQDPTQIAGLAVFRTDDPSAAFDLVRKDMETKIPHPDTAFTIGDTFDDFCVYNSTISMPVYQTGVSPFSYTGGGWVFDQNGNPVEQGTESARFVVTIPRKEMPAAGFPIVVLSRTGAGGDRPLVDRGVQGVTGGPPLLPGTGPALYYAHAGYAGSEIDGPLGGLRNPMNENEDFLIFNVQNPLALRDNIRQSAAELALQAHILQNVSIDASACTGVTTQGGAPVHFDPATIALMGHSMGATISPLALAWEPDFRAGILSGAGGSWIENIIYKLQPLNVKSAMEVILGIIHTYQFHEHDPLLSMFQWAGEPADPPVYTRLIAREPPMGSSPRHVLMEQGIVDHYILPAIANATSLSTGLDFAGMPLDSTVPELSNFTPLASLLDLSGAMQVGYPVQGNMVLADGTMVTAMVAQHPSDGIEDGHEIVFQTDPPKHQYTCFLQSLLTGIPKVPPDGMADDPCPP